MGSFFMRATPPERAIVVQCKGCQRYVAPDTVTIPTEAIAVTCGLCGERRRYRPSEVFWGLLDMAARRKPPTTEEPKHRQYRQKA